MIVGISGHILGPKGLRRLSRLTGLDLGRAYIRNQEAEGIVYGEDSHTHYDIDPRTGEVWIIIDPRHWASCRIDR